MFGGLNILIQFVIGRKKVSILNFGNRKVGLGGTVEPIETFLSSFYGTTPGVQPLSFAREWREKNRSPHETEISTLSRIFFKIKHQISVGRCQFWTTSVISESYDILILIVLDHMVYRHINNYHYIKRGNQKKNDSEESGPDKTGQIQK